jgi:hypothetical protein
MFKYFACHATIVLDLHSFHISRRSVPGTDDGYCTCGNSSGRGKGGSVICFENITSELW